MCHFVRTLSVSQHRFLFWLLMVYSFHQGEDGENVLLLFLWHELPFPLVALGVSLGSSGPSGGGCCQSWLPLLPRFLQLCHCVCTSLGVTLLNSKSQAQVTFSGRIYFLHEKIYSPGSRPAGTAAGLPVPVLQIVYYVVYDQATPKELIT